MTYTYLNHWRRWFAWRPVRLQFTKRLVWLRFVEFERIKMPRSSIMGGGGVVTHYRPHWPRIAALTVNFALWGGVYAAIRWAL